MKFDSMAEEVSHKFMIKARGMSRDICNILYDYDMECNKSKIHDIVYECTGNILVKIAELYRNGGDDGKGAEGSTEDNG